MEMNDKTMEDYKSEVVFQPGPEPEVMSQSQIELVPSEANLTPQIQAEMDESSEDINIPAQ